MTTTPPPGVPGNDQLLVEQDGNVVTVTLNRPEARNALSAELLAELARTWAWIDARPDVWVAILTGAGGNFCAGADLKRMHTGEREAEQADDTVDRLVNGSETAWRGLLRHHRLTKPLIAAVEGFALAGGTEILQSTDIRIAGRSAVFGLAEVRWGLFPLGGSTVRLRRQIPYTQAMDMLLTGRKITAEEALAMGLVGRVVEDGTALERAREVAALVAANGPLAVQAVKRSVRESEGLSEQDALRHELEIGAPVFATADAKEGTTAFRERRAPRFQGR